MTDLPMPAVRPRHSPQMTEMRSWKICTGTATIPWACNVEGIESRCHATCCKSGWWPPKDSETGHCVWLDDATGCTLGEARPLACHLYPLQLSKHGTLVPAAESRWPTRLCMGNRGAAGAPMLIDALRDSLILIFGADQYWAARAATVDNGEDYVFTVPDWANAAIEQEAQWEERGERPQPRVAHR